MSSVSAPTRTDADFHDPTFMRVALGLARRGLGNVWPNPAVGCVLVKDGSVAGRGWTQPGGRPHAETEALARAGELAKGATAYVTLEPCSHHGKTPPCAEALIAAGVSRVVVACEDANPKVAGQGVAALRKAGIEVDIGQCGDQARELNAGFFTRIAAGRPLVTLKLATSLDGRIAAATGDSKWITGEMARDFAHGLRARHDAVAVGIGTVEADDPELTSRLPGAPVRPGVRIVFDTNARISAGSRLVGSVSDAPLWLVTAADAPDRPDLPDAVERLGVARSKEGSIDMAAALGALGDRGLTRLMVEGGGRVAGALLRAGLIDELYWIRAGAVIGGDGVPAIGDLGLAAVADAPRFVMRDRRQTGGDIVERWSPADQSEL